MKARIFAIILVGGLLIWGLGAIGVADGPVHQPQNTSAAKSSTLFVDLPAGHWAAADIKYLVERGIITGLPGGRFNGNKPLTRYQAATMVARTVRYIFKNTGSQVSQKATAPALGQVSPQDIKALQNLLFQVSDQQQKSNGQLDQLKGTVAAIQAKTGTNPELVSQIKNLQSQSGLIQAMQRRLDQQEQTIRQMQSKISKFQVRSSTTSEQQLEGVKRQANGNFIISIVGLIFGIIGIALATMR